MIENHLCLFVRSSDDITHCSQRCKWTENNAETLLSRGLERFFLPAVTILISL